MCTEGGFPKNWKVKWEGVEKDVVNNHSFIVFLQKKDDEKL